MRDRREGFRMGEAWRGKRPSGRVPLVLLSIERIKFVQPLALCCDEQVETIAEICRTVVQDSKCKRCLCEFVLVSGFGAGFMACTNISQGLSTHTEIHLT